MPSRLVLIVAVLCGAVGIVCVPAAHAQAPPNSVRFVKLLLMKESTKIKANTTALNMRDRDIAKLDAATRRSQINSLTRSLDKLHTQILHNTTFLQVFSTQVFTDAEALSPPDPALVSQAFAGILSVQTQSVRASLGIAPATPKH
jgi:hypothetical protein